MLGFLVFLGAWNVVSLVLGIVGLFKPEMRPRLARLVNLQASAAIVISLACTLLAILFSAVPWLSSIGQTVGWFFWAAGGLLPLTITMLLRAGPRRHGES